ncbi:hypothetical protein WJX72_001866 [[Myrmecia] bisecta]|uniref:Uncharacterized protein n=1 Tax=[Myrmecia] bisecta TaxID=41462 RepID=A0AAW1Q2X8_9CHLO
MTPCDLWPYLRGRTTWIIGDSQALDFHIALECFMKEFWGLEETPMTDDQAVLDKFIAIASIAGHDVPHCEVLPEHSRICFIRANNGNDTINVAMPLLEQGLAKPEDVMVVNFGLHHREEAAYVELLQRFVQQYEQNKARFPNIIWKDTAPQHFKTQTGLHEKGLGQPPFECAPIANVSIQPDHVLTASHAGQEAVLRGSWRNELANELIRNAGMPIIEGWNETVPLWEYHRDNVLRGYECGHYCHPSASEVWVFQLYETLKAHIAPLSTHSLQQ